MGFFLVSASFAFEGSHLFTRNNWANIAAYVCQKFSWS